MKSFKPVAAFAAILAVAAVANPAKAQMMQVGADQFGNPVCIGPLGPQVVAPCVVIQNWIMQHQSGMVPPTAFNQPAFNLNAPAPQVQNNGGGGNNGNNGWPQFPTLGQDTQFLQSAGPVIEGLGAAFGG